MTDDTPITKPKRTLARLLAVLKDRKGYFAAGLILVLVSTVFELAVPAVTQQAIDYIDTAQSVKYLWVFVAVLAGIVAGKVFSYYSYWIISVKLGERVLWQLRDKLYDKVENLSFDFHTKNESGQLISKIISDIHQIRHFYLNVIFMFTEAVFVLVGVLIFMLIKSVPLTLLTLAPVPVLILLLVRFGSTIGKKFLAVRQRYGNITTELKENISGVRVVRAFAHERFEKAKFSITSQVYLNKLMDAVNTWANNMPIFLTLFGITTPIVIFFGAYYISTGAFTLGALAAFTFLLGLLFARIQMITRIVIMAERAIASGQRIFGILDAESSITEKPDAVNVEAPGVKGFVKFDDVHFSYNGKEILKGISFEAAPGTIVAVIGKTGSGKSTLAHLIPRFYDVTNGRITIDGRDVRDFEVENLRSIASIVFQDTFLFNARVRDNIAYGRPDAPLAEVKRAASIAQASPFIEKYAAGYDTMIGEHGLNLSGGQKQRIAIARAILAKPRILILDDSTSSVDASMEAHIHREITRIKRDYTIFLIAHRFSTVASADRIIVLEDGKILQDGTHAELLAQEGYYKKMYQLQYGSDTA